MAISWQFPGNFLRISRSILAPSIATQPYSTTVNTVPASTCLAIHCTKKRLPVEDYLEILPLALDTILPPSSQICHVEITSITRPPHLTTILALPEAQQICQHAIALTRAFTIRQQRAHNASALSAANQIINYSNVLNATLRSLQIPPSINTFADVVV